MEWMLDSLRSSPAHSLTFRTFSSEDIKSLSVVKIVSPETFTVLGHAKPGGLYDEAMGPIEQLGVCSTCGFKKVSCPGHMGHIELPLLVINPLFHKVIENLLKMSCVSCYKILIPDFIKYLLIGQIKLLDKGYLAESIELAERFSYFDVSWENSSKNDIGSTLLFRTSIDQFVDEVLSKAAGMVREVRGEAQLRNSFVKTAKSRLFKNNRCPYCKGNWKVISCVQNKLMIDTGKLELQKRKKGSCVAFLLPTQCETLLKKIWVHEAEFMKALVPMLEHTKEAEPIDALFMKAIAVTPNNARPVQFVDKRTVEHPISMIYTAILYDCLDVKTIILVMNNKDGEGGLSDMRRDLVISLRGESYPEKLQHAWQKLQTDVDSLLDIDMKRVRFPKGLGIKQIIEKKQGCIRMNMMGKRVNFAARTVITPDPNLNINEIGIPKIFAKRLTFPVPVTPWNVVELRKIVNNGPESYPGANYVDYEDGSRVRLNEKDVVQRQSIANTLLTPGYSKSGLKGVKVVHRHLRNGDMVLLNRQPTLHRPSIMAHKVRVLEGEKTFRMHYANCKSYNADFDGDEMNVHFPQHQAARSEAFFLANVSTQYLVPKDGTPLSGLIQDYMVSGVRLSVRGKMFNRHDYMQLVYQSLSYVDGDIKTLQPCIIKPVECWSGKQIISTIIINLIPKGDAPINLISKSKISQKAWGHGPTRPWIAGGTPFKRDITMSEAEVIIRSGELLCGVLDKMHYGATPYSLVHCMYELYGGDVSCALLSSFSRLFTAFLQMEGFSLGVEDILVSKKSDKKRSKLIEKVRSIGNDIVSTLVDAAPNDENSLKKEISEMFNKDPLFKIVLDHKYKTNLDTFTNKINQACMPNGLLKRFPDNSLQLMVQSGAKGSTVNTMQISCLLGQIELEGKRPPLMLSGKALPSFPQYDTSPRAGGFVDGRFMTGIKPQEFFFHCMAGREGLIDTAVKTSRSGYLQRCLVKHLEGVSVQYDRTVRDVDGSVIQFLYGEDGLEVTKSQFLKSEQLPFLIDNMSAIRDTDILESYKANNCDFKAVKTYRKKVNKWHSSGGRKARSTPFLKFCEDMKESIESPNSEKINPTTGRAFRSDTLCDMWYELTDEEKLKYECSAALTPDTMVSKLNPDKYYGSITEKLEELIDHYLTNNRKEVEERSLRRMITDKFLGSLCPPGEPVGMLAAQSVGEPSTQMTLNTFHFAGRGEMNVTLGIPRLIEILMVASKNIKTPSMVIPFVQHDNSDKFDKKSDRLRRHLTRVTLADVLEYIEVHEKIEVRPRRIQVYVFKLQFLPHEAYKESTKVTPKQILRYVESKFLKHLVSFMTAKKNRKAFEIAVAKVAQEKDDEDIDGEEGTNSKKGNQRKRGGVLDEADNDDEDDESNDSDNEGADATKRRSRHENDQEYSDEEDENKVEEEGGGDPIEEDWNVDEPEAEETKEEKPDVKLLEQQMAEVRAELEKRKAKVIAQDSIMDYKFDTERYEWCELTVGLFISNNQIELSSRLKELAAKCVIHQVPGVNRAFIQTNPNGEKVLRTDGINVDEIYTYDNLLELNKLYMNDVHIMAAMYGIDAAASVIVKEVKDVFKVYGITVDPRHLTLIADYMTFDGIYRPLSRKTMEGGASPIQGMSFESSLTVLKNAVLQSRTDTLTNPSSRLMFGMPIKAGTGAFSLFYKIQQLT